MQLAAIGTVESTLRDRASAPLQGDEGAPEATIAFDEGVAAALDGIAPGDEVLVLTWLHEAARDVLRVNPRGDRSRAEQGVFATRSPDRPNPIGLHRVTVVAVDGTPVVDVKPVLGGVEDR